MKLQVCEARPKCEMLGMFSSEIYNGRESRNDYCILLILKTGSLKEDCIRDSLSLLHTGCIFLSVCLTFKTLAVFLVSTIVFLNERRGIDWNKLDDPRYLFQFHYRFQSSFSFIRYQGIRGAIFKTNRFLLFHVLGPVSFLKLPLTAGWRCSYGTQ